MSQRVSRKLPRRLLMAKAWEMKRSWKIMVISIWKFKRNKAQEFDLPKSWQIGIGCKEIRVGTAIACG